MTWKFRVWSILHLLYCCQVYFQYDITDHCLNWLWLITILVHLIILSMLIASEFVLAVTLISYWTKLCFYFGTFSFKYFDSLIKPEFKDIGTSAICYQVICQHYFLCHAAIFVQIFWGDSSKSAMNFTTWQSCTGNLDLPIENNWVDWK